MDGVAAAPKSLADYGHTEPRRGAEWWGKSVLLTLRFSKVSRRQGGTLGGRYRRNGYVLGRTVSAVRPPSQRCGDPTSQLPHLVCSYPVDTGRSAWHRGTTLPKPPNRQAIPHQRQPRQQTARRADPGEAEVAADPTAHQRTTADADVVDPGKHRHGHIGGVRCQHQHLGLHGQAKAHDRHAPKMLSPTR